VISLTPTDTWSRIRSSLMIQQLNTKEYSTITANDRISVLCRGARNVFKLSVNEARYCTAGALRAPSALCPRGHRQQEENCRLLEKFATEIPGGAIGEKRVAADKGVNVVPVVPMFQTLGTEPSSGTKLPVPGFESESVNFLDVVETSRTAIRNTIAAKSPFLNLPTRDPKPGT
jgi:hypothetical protein